MFSKHVGWCSWCRIHYFSDTSHCLLCAPVALSQRRSCVGLYRTSISSDLDQVLRTHDFRHGVSASGSVPASDTHRSIGRIQFLPTDPTLI